MDGWPLFISYTYLEAGAAKGGAAGADRAGRGAGLVERFCWLPALGGSSCTSSC
jgi:hypothetical protein